MSAPSLKPDEFAKALAAGSARTVWGLNLNALSPPPLELKVYLLIHWIFYINCNVLCWCALQASYEALCERVRSCLTADERDCVYMYPFEFLHLTVASPAPFVHHLQPAGSIGKSIEDPAQQALVRVFYSHEEVV